MAWKPSLRAALLFSAALIVTMPFWLVLWGYLLPRYGRVLGVVTGAVLSGILGVPLDGVHVDAHGLFNTRTALVFELAQRSPQLNVGALVFNVPPFLALMSLSPGLAWRRRIRATFIGLGILMTGHVVYVVLAYRFASTIAASPEIPTVLGELFLTLPVLLWIVLGYSEAISGRQVNHDIPEKVKSDGESDDASVG